MPFPLNDGGAIGIYNITKSLSELGHEITLVTYRLGSSAQTESAVRDISRFAKVHVASRPLPPRAKVLARTLVRGAYPIERRMMPEMFELIRSLVEQEKFDLVHVDHSHMGKYGLWLKEEFGLPIVLREHNFEALIYERFARTEPNVAKRRVAAMHGKRLKREEIRFLKNFDAVAAITYQDAEIMRQVAPKANIHVIPAGVDTDFFKPTNAPEDPNKLLSLGSLGWDPNYDAVRFFLTSIFPLILDRRPETTFDIIGSGSERVAKLASRFGDKVSLLGQVPDVRDYLARSAVLAVPLRIGGGMRLKLLEFFAAGKAVVSTSIGAEGNMGVNGVHLLLRDDPADFAEAVLELLTSDVLRETLRMNARELVLKEYSWRHIAQDFTKLYEQAMSVRKNHSLA